MPTDIKTESETLVREATLNLSENDFDSAEHKLRDAVALNPALADAHRLLGRTRSYKAASAKDADVRKRLLTEAELRIRKSIELAGESAFALHDLGWICDERGTADDLEQAVALYRKALEAFSRTESRENDLTAIRYNLACSLTKLGRDHFKEAIEALTPVFKDPWREDVSPIAERDPDLEPLRTWEEGKALGELIAIGRNRSSDAARKNSVA
jgi:tetratricopeptide (TPR) repeat protein